MLFSRLNKWIDGPGAAVRRAGAGINAARGLWQFGYVVLATTVVFAARLNWAYDDPFITYRYADNLTRGLGFVYNPGERVLSTTAPLFALGLALLKNIWSDLPHLAVLLGSFSLALGALLLWELARCWRAPLVGWVGLLLYPSFLLVLNTLGSETPIYLAFCLGAFTFYARRQYSWASVLAALAMLARADGVLVALILGSDFLLHRLRPIPWRALALFVVIVLPWYLFSFGYFGSFFPVTLAVKQHQGSMAISQRFAPGLLTILRSYASGWPYWLEAGLAGAGFLFVTLRRRAWWPVLAWPVVYFVAYTLLGVSRYFWYYAPLVPGFLVAVGLGLEGLVFVLRQTPRWAKHLGPLFAVVALLVLALAQGRGVVSSWQVTDNRVQIYRAVGEWLAANTPPESSVGALEVGIIGYYARRPMIDFAGLIQPAVSEQLTKTATYQDSAHWAIMAYHPDYLLLGSTWFPALMSETVLPHCQERQKFVGAPYGYPGELVVYQCKWTAGSEGVGEAVLQSPGVKTNIKL